MVIFNIILIVLNPVDGYVQYYPNHENPADTIREKPLFLKQIKPN